MWRKRGGDPVETLACEGKRDSGLWRGSGGSIWVDVVWSVRRGRRFSACCDLQGAGPRELFSHRERRREEDVRRCGL
ncbi:hypothetical protein NDU88_009707 [Pleurodeles waltl]|uniref:Uncharacterized protein n=1 Tax=Pleurodeles waltl TaxID=8319 RepID=A0AAV7QY99_PLEWA|nr:hypothetical protein NDU88_009707 [Pleurodeles waltl]